jgi:signal peptidase II
MQESSSSKTTTFQWAFLVSVALFIIALDQISKAIVLANLELYETWVPIPALSRVFEFTYTRNTGAAFGILSSASNFFLIIALVASVVIIYYYRQIDNSAWLIRIAMGLQLGGAIGNAVDRIVHGYVIDFIHVFYEPHFDYPIFNIADSSIVVGVIVLMILLWQEERQAKKSVAKSTDDSFSLPADNAEQIGLVIPEE